MLIHRKRGTVNVIMTPIVGISGAKGSFSEEAALYFLHKFGDRQGDLQYLVSVENVLSALEKKEITLGIFPIENSNGGIVIEAVYAMAKHMFSIERLFEIDVHHNLLVYPGTNPDEITAIASHDQALKQCRMYLKRKWPTVEVQAYPDTAKAAEDLGSGVLPKTTAVIAPRTCAELYKLDLLEESIQDLKFNYTTFIAAVAVS